ncbi:MAG: PorT-related protein [Chitinophagaceae bacterium]|nr:PorT-related protein [Chitinophagaceae bacterium]
MYYLCGKKSLIALLVFLIVSTTARAQDPKWSNSPKYDDRILHYGFSIGLGTSGYHAKLSQTFLNDTVNSVRPTFSSAFTLGFVVSLRLAEQLDLRLLPTVGFYEHQVDYKFLTTTNTQSIESTFLEFPLLLKYKSQRRRNSRMYLVAGGKLSVEAGAKKKEKKKTELRTQGTDFAVEYGVGFDFYMPLFKFSPELRMSHGLVNMLVPDQNIYSQSISKLTTHTLTLYLHFE